MYFAAAWLTPTEIHYPPNHGNIMRKAAIRLSLSEPDMHCLTTQPGLAGDADRALISTLTYLGLKNLYVILTTVV